MIEQYEIVRKLGSGGSGVVYLASDTLLTRPVVLKILRRGLLTLAQMQATVLREARLASAIEHPNVCAIYEVGETGDEAYIVMQFVPGQSLDLLIERGAAHVQLVLSVGIQIADGLQAAHSLGIFHRDLKPQNVMLTDGGLVKILDFGLARRLHPEDATFDPAKPGELQAKQDSLNRTMLTQCIRDVEHGLDEIAAKQAADRPRLAAYLIDVVNDASDYENDFTVPL